MRGLSSVEHRGAAVGPASRQNQHRRNPSSRRTRARWTPPQDSRHDPLTWRIEASDWDEAETPWEGLKSGASGAKRDRLVQGVLGHSDIGITASTYVHPDCSVYTDAAAKMNAFLRASGGDFGGTHGGTNVVEPRKPSVGL